MSIEGIRSVASTAQAGGLAALKPSPSAGFGDLLTSAIDKVNDKQLIAQDAIKSLAAGNADNVHEVVLAEVDAEISFKMLAQTRNKLVEAYKEIMRMDV